MIRLGHISYSNCFPIHSRLIDRPAEGDPELVVGVPSELNDLLARGRIDVAPCSSIEYARHSAEYRILPDLVIGARGAVQSILFLSTRPPSELGDGVVAVPNASATSVVLLKILLRQRWGVTPEFRWFDQLASDPFAEGAHAALFIGDVALRRDLYPSAEHRFDLGEEWLAHTGLPFAFAIWQAGGGDDAALIRLHESLVASRAYGRQNRSLLAGRYADHFGMPARELETYWSTLVFDLDEAMLEGLRAFYEGAAEVGAIGEAPRLRFVGQGAIL